MILKGINCISKWIGLATALSVVCSGFVMLLITGVEAEENGRAFWGFSADTWLELHEKSAILLVIASASHLLLRWKQFVNICTQSIRGPKRLFREPVVLVPLFIAVLLSIAVLPDEAQSEPGDEEDENFSISQSLGAYPHVFAGVVSGTVITFHIVKRKRRMI